MFIFMTKLASRLAEATEDPRESTLLFERISIAISQGNTASIMSCYRRGLRWNCVEGSSSINQSAWCSRNCNLVFYFYIHTTSNLLVLIFFTYILLYTKKQMNAKRTIAQTWQLLMEYWWTDRRCGLGQSWSTITNSCSYSPTSLRIIHTSPWP